LPFASQFHHRNVLLLSYLRLQWRQSSNNPVTHDPIVALPALGARIGTIRLSSTPLRDKCRDAMIRKIILANSIIAASLAQCMRA
jgi:hypothetical protein